MALMLLVWPPHPMKNEKYPSSLARNARLSASLRT